MVLLKFVFKKSAWLIIKRLTVIVNSAILKSEISPKIGKIFQNVIFQSIKRITDHKVKCTLNTNTDAIIL